MNDAVEEAGGTGEEHSELSTVSEESDHIVGEEHHARCAHSDEEAGSIVLHVRRDMNENEKDSEAGETAAAKETVEISKEDVEIRRLIEERRNTPKEEKQHLREVSKCFKNVSETKK